MKCPDCEHENAHAAKFCEQCGASLGGVCTYCGNRVSAAAKFCTECGHRLRLEAGASRFASPKIYTPQHLADKIVTSRSALEGERKQVTVLFADIKGSMDLFGERDPEAAQKIFDPVLERMIEAVHRYEGTVNRVMGDGILALFGAPIAHEDHAVRACYAGLRMQETVARYSEEIQRTDKVEVAIRVALSSGEIVVCGIGNDLHMDYTVVGQTVNLAARLEQIAKPGSVIATHQTFQLAEGFVSMRPLGPARVKGIADPVQVYEVTGPGDAQTRFQVAAKRGLTRFVGREVELEQLRRVQQLVGQGHGQVTAVLGEAGVGKSRLVREFLHSQQTRDWLVLESSSPSYGHATPYLPVIELLRSYFTLTNRDSTQFIRQKVRDKMMALDSSLQDAIAPVLDLLDALEENDPFRSLDLVERRQSTYRAVVGLLLSEARRQPVLTVFEDLHWHDSLSLGLLNELVVAAQGAPLFLLVTYRPEYRDEWKNRPNYRLLRLDPLASESLADFMEAVLGPDQSLPALKTFLVERASGNPFFIEEIVRRLADTGVLEGTRAAYRLTKPFSSTEVPPTVQAVIAARVDALPGAHKHLLQAAAVIGYNVPFTLLHAICGLAEDNLRGLLDNLQAGEFLYSSQLFPDLQYTFKHAFTHDVAYTSVLREVRSGIHARVVNAIERLYADRLSEHVERLAHHAVRGDLKEKAVRYLRQAGAKAAARSAPKDARAWFEQALDTLKGLPESQASMEEAFEIYLELRPVLRQLGEGRQMLEYLREAEAISERLNDDLRRGQVCAFMTTVLSSFDDLDEAVLTGARALEIARRLSNLRLRILSTTYLEQAYYYKGQYEQVIAYGTENLSVLPAEWAHEYFGMAVPASVFGRAWLVLSLAELGRFNEAEKYAAEALQLAEPTKHTHTIGWARVPASMIHLFKGDWVQAKSLIEQWVNIRQTLDVAVLLPWAISSSAWALAQIGESSQALSRVQETEELLDRQAATGVVGHRGWAYHAVSRACLLLGRLDDARRLSYRSVESSRRHPGFAAHASHLFGDIATYPDRFDAEGGAAHYQEALALATRQGMRPLMAHCHLGLGKLYQRIGKSDEARENLATATAMYRSMEMNFWLDQALK